MRYPIMSSRDENAEAPRRRLRVPGALAVAFVGSSAAVTVWYGGCDAGSVDAAPDAGGIEMQRDAEAPNDAGTPGEDAPAPIDAPLPAPDAPRDAAPPIDAPPDAAPPPH